MSIQANKIQTHRFDYATPENPADFNPADFVEKAISWVKSLVKPGEKIALSASGGVDSTIAAFLLDRIVGKDLHAFFIEDGCRRLINDAPEGEVTREIFSKLNFTVLEVRDQILPPLLGLSDGEEKRKTFIGNYRKVSDRYISQVGASWIADGTIAPDIIETEGGFKSQHNVGWNYSVGKIEPLASLAKPQVRKVGEYLDLPPSFTHRIPCPGPAQILRTVGEFTEEKLRTSQLASDIVEQETKKYYTEKHGRPYLYDETTGIRTPFQYFGVALDPNMEPDPALADLARSTLGANAECFRMDNQTTVVPEEGTRPETPIYKPVSWIKIDGDMDYDKLNALCIEAWSKLELPRILIELCENDAPKTRYVVGMRAIESAAAKLARPVRIDEAALLAIGKKIAAHTGASRVAYDISTKPPATIEFEQIGDVVDKLHKFANQALERVKPLNSSLGIYKYRRIAVMTEEHPNLVVLRKFDPTNIAGSADILAEDAVWHFFNPKLPDVQGDYVGLKGFQDFFEKIGVRTDGTLKINPISITAVGDELVVAHTKNTMTLEDRHIETDVVVVWRIVDGLITEIWDIPSVNTQENKKIATRQVKRRFDPLLLPWEERKRHTFEFLQGASLEVKLVTLADKLNNIEAIAADYLEIGEVLWERFNRGKDAQKWYYQGLVQALRDGSAIEAYQNLHSRFAKAVIGVFGNEN